MTRDPGVPMSDARLYELRMGADNALANPHLFSASQWNAAKAVAECLTEISRLRGEVERMREALDEIGGGVMCGQEAASVARRARAGSAT